MTHPATGAFNPSSQVQAVTALLRSYESGLNAADVDAIVALYAADGILMAQHCCATIRNHHRRQLEFTI